MEQEPGELPENVTPLPSEGSRSPGSARLGALGRELRRHPYAYVVALAFAVAGAIVAPLLFPDASPWLGAIGGLVLGVYAALCAVPNKFLG